MSTYDAVTVANALTDFALKYENAKAIADQACPPVAADRRKFKYWKYLRKDIAHISVAAVSSTGIANTRKMGQSISDEIEVLDYALSDFVPMDDLSQADEPLELEQDTTDDLVGDLILAREKRVADLLMTAGSYATANKVTLGTAWTTAATSTPIADIQTGIRACAMPPNKMIMDKPTFDALARHPSIISTLRNLSSKGLATAAEIAGYFGLEELLVGEMKYNTANDGQTESLSYVWPLGQVVIAHIPNAIKRKQATLCRTFRSAEDAGRGAAASGGDVSQGAGIVVTTWVEARRGAKKGALGIKAGLQEVSTLIAADCGYHITNAAA